MLGAISFFGISYSAGWHIADEILSGEFKGRYNFTNELDLSQVQTLVNSNSSEEGYLRIGDIQIVWGRYTSNGPAHGVKTINFPIEFINTNYRLVLTPQQTQRELARYSKVVGKRNSNFTVQTYYNGDFGLNIDTGYSALGGDYIAIGKWR